MPHIPGTPKTKQGILRKIISKFAIYKLKRWGEKNNKITKIIPKFAILKSKKLKKTAFKNSLLKQFFKRKISSKNEKNIFNKKRAVFTFL